MSTLNFEAILPTKDQLTVYARENMLADDLTIKNNINNVLKVIARGVEQAVIVHETQVKYTVEELLERAEIKVESTDKDTIGRILRDYLITNISKNDDEGMYGFKYSEEERTITMNWASVHQERESDNRMGIPFPFIPR